MSSWGDDVPEREINPPEWEDEDEDASSSDADDYNDMLTDFKIEEEYREK